MPHFNFCKSIGCRNPAKLQQDYCASCQNRELFPMSSLTHPDQYKAVGDMEEIDTYAVHHLFKIGDSSGCIQQASAKLLMSASSFTLHADVRKARDLLTRWLQLNQESIT